MDDDNRPRANPMPPAAPPGYHSTDEHPEEFKMADSPIMDKARDLITGGALGTMKKAITPKNMNYYHEDDGK